MSLDNTTIYKVNDFFDAYANALEHYDTKAMTTYYSLPCSFIADESVSVFTDAAKLEGLFNQATLFYKQFGIAHARPEIWSKRSWTNRIVKVKLKWDYFDGNNQPVYNCDYHYIIRLDKNDHWKIEVAVAVNEKQNMEAWLAKQPEKH